MAVQRLSLSDIRTEVLRIVGNYDSSTNADWRTDANLYSVINRYAQNLSSRSAQMAKMSGLIGLPWYKTTATASLSGQTIYMPVDMDRLISLYDATENRPIRVVTNIYKWHSNLVKKPAGPVEVVQLLDWVSWLDGDGVTTWRQRGLMHPTPDTSPSITVVYYRLPALMPGTTPATEYPDAPVKYHTLWIYGTALEILAPNAPGYDRYADLEKQMLLEIARSAEVLS